MAIRVVLGEDSLLAREGIMRVLERDEEIALVEAAGDLDALRAAIDRERPDVLLTDIRMPPGHTDEGIRLAVELRSTHPEIGVVVLSQHGEPLYAIALFRDGSEGRAYLLKDRLRDEGELARAVREVAGGGSLVDSRVVADLVAMRTRSEDSKLARLTDREREILALIAEGKSNGAIADELRITKRGVERHVNSIFGKLDLVESPDVSRRVLATLVYLSGVSS
ncbi:MAG TPA: response regulator transcription factor [Gaiellaceae bacterium]|jgi:DNA-binding NarL/FixJ family response regulator